jgi:putative ABC transport system permease protein
VGVLKTLGFTPGAVLGLILGEACVISVCGGAIGFAISTLLLRGVEKSPFGGFLPPLPVVDPGVAVVCLITAGIIGVLSSLVPAMGASRLPIVQALRSTD